MQLYDDLLFKSFIQNRGLKESTIKKYHRHLVIYCEFLNKTPTEIIDEAERDEDKAIRMRNRSIKKYLLNFKSYLETKNYSKINISTIITTIRTFYKEYDIILPDMHLKHGIKNESIEDIPSKEDISKALNFANIKYQALILLISSSGMGSAEVRSLTYHDFLKSISEYVERPVNSIVSIGDIIQELEYNNDQSIILVPCFKIIRVKTGTPIITFCTPECLTRLLEYLKQDPPTKLTDPLFRTLEGKPLRDNVIARYFQTLNKKCGFGKTNRQVKFRSHAVGRKYFATTLINKVGLQQITIDFFLGHSLGKTSTAYFKADPESLKEQYLTCIEDLSIEKIKVQVHDIDSEDKKELKDLRKTVDRLQQIVDNQNFVDKLPPKE